MFKYLFLLILLTGCYIPTPTPTQSNVKNVTVLKNVGRNRVVWKFHWSYDYYTPYSEWCYTRDYGLKCFIKPCVRHKVCYDHCEYKRSRSQEKSCYESYYYRKGV